jgi:hypothetical protein
MFTIKNNIISFVVLMIVMTFGVPYSYSQNKSSEEIPSEEIMKKILLNRIIINDLGLFKFTNAKFDVFQISNGFFSKDNSGSGSTVYTIRVNYKISYVRSYYEILAQPPGWKGHVGMKLPTLSAVDKYAKLGCKVSSLKTENQFKENNREFSFIKKGNTWWDNNYWDYFIEEAKEEKEPTSLPPLPPLPPPPPPPPD